MLGVPARKTGKNWKVSKWIEKNGIKDTMFTLLFTPTKKHLQILLRKCLIIKSPLQGSNPRPTDYKSILILNLYNSILAYSIG